MISLAQVRFLIIAFGFFLTASSLNAQGERVLPAKYYVDLRGEKKAPNLRSMGDGVTWEPAGARVTLPGGQGAQRASGLSPDFHVEGDFEITFAYEIIKFDQPAKGFGNGPSLYVAIDAKAGNAASIARRVMTSGKNMFVTARTHNAAKLKSEIGTMPANASTGKLRIERVGKLVRFSCAEGDDPVFKLINETKFSDEPISFVQIGGNPGGGEAELDMRLLELTIRAERLPGYDVPVPVVNDAPGDVPQTSSNTWLYIAGAVAVVLLLLVAMGFVAVLVLRRRLRPATSAKRSPAPIDANQRPLSFVCTECGKKLKAKPQSRGNTLKCPFCGKTTVSEPPTLVGGGT